MTRSRARLSLVTALLVLAACSPSSEPDTNADAQTLRELTTQAIAAFNAADAAAGSSRYTDDAVRMQPDGPSLESREAIQRAGEEYFQQFTATQTATVDEVQVFGDVAFSRGTYRVLETPKAGGDEVERNGKWLVIHERQSDGQWRSARHIWNQQP